jgi:uncharacterized MAPEG superfamily protein
MTTGLWCLVGFAGWAMLLVVGVVSYRSLQVLLGRAASNAFPGGTPHGPDAYQRLNRAHQNTVENLAIFAAIMVAASFAHASSPAFTRLPCVVLGARILQSVVHVSSGSVLAVNLRFAAFLTQYACFAWMILALLRIS